MLHIITAILFLCLASLFTLMGVTGLYIFIFAAAPCYFLFFLFLFCAQSAKALEKVTIRHKKTRVIDFD